MEFDLNDGYTGIISLPTASNDHLLPFLDDSPVEEGSVYIFLKRCCQYYYDCESFFLNGNAVWVYVVILREHVKGH